MSQDPIHLPEHHRSGGTRPDSAAGYRLGPVDDLTDLTPAQQAQLRAIVTHAVAIATRHVDEPMRDDATAKRSPLAEPGVWVVLVMLALVTIVAIVALGAVLGLSAINA